MAKKVIRLTEADIEKLVLRVINEQLVSVGKTEGQDYESRVFDTNHPGFQKWLNSIKYYLGTFEERTGVAPDYNAMVRRRAGLSTLRLVICHSMLVEKNYQWMTAPRHCSSLAFSRFKTIYHKLFMTI